MLGLQGDLVIKAGQEGDSMYFINSGSVSVLVDGMEIDKKGIGGFFGEAALVLKQTRIADVKYVTSLTQKLGRSISFVFARFPHVFS